MFPHPTLFINRCLIQKRKEQLAIKASQKIRI